MPEARAVERLARQLYEANDGTSTPWPRRGWEVRQAWIGSARRQIAGTDVPPARPSVWQGIASLFRL